VDVAQARPDAARITLRASDTIPNKDFVLDYKLGSDRPRFALFTHRPTTSEAGYFTLMLQPQTDFTVNEVTPKEVFFLVDASGSMSGGPIEKMKDTMRHALQNLNPEDTFYVARFANSTVRFSEQPLPGTPDNLIGGLHFIDNIEAGGGTEMLPGILDVLRYPHDDDRLRIVIVMSDGLIGNERQILSAIEADLGGQSRLFTFGIGSSQNRYLLDNMARLGQGAFYGVSLADSSEKVVGEFYERIRSPLFTDISIDWGGMVVDELYPALLPDLFAGQPVYLHGRYRAPGSTQVRVTGRTANVAGGLAAFLAKATGSGAPVDRTQQLFTIDGKFPPLESANTWVGRLWARSKIADLSDKLRQNVGGAAIIEEITQLGLQHRLSTEYTSFVAVEEVPVVESGELPTRIDVPVPLPEGTAYEGFFGEQEGLKTTAQSVGFSQPTLLANPLPSSDATFGVSFDLATGTDVRPALIRVALGIGVFIGVAFLPLLVGLLAASIIRFRERHSEVRTPVGRVVGRVSTLMIAVVAGMALTVSALFGDEFEVTPLGVAAAVAGVIAVVYGPIGLGIGAARLRRRFAHRHGREIRARGTFWTVTILSYLALVGGVAVLIGYGGLEFITDLFHYVPLAITVVLLALGSIRILSWRHVMWFALGVLTLGYAYRTYAVIYALVVAPNLFPVTTLVADPRLFTPIIFFVVMLIALLGLRISKRWGVVVVALISVLTLIPLLLNMPLPLRAVGWQVASVAVLLSLYLARDSLLGGRESAQSNSAA
jgi:hypothetical protein